MAAGALTGSVVGLAVAVAVSGSAYSMFLISRQGFMIEAVPEGFRARALSTMGGAFRVGVFVGPLLGAGLIRLAGIPGRVLDGGGAVARRRVDGAADARPRGREPRPGAGGRPRVGVVGAGRSTGGPT